MSADSSKLPDRPHLEHLKKRAKDRLTALRASDADAALADAQRAVANEYGYPSWRALKAEVDRRRADIDREAALNDAMRAADEGDLEHLQQLVSQYPDFINSKHGEWAHTLLHKAAWTSRTEMVRWLLDQGADPLYRCKGDNAYALHFAAGEGNLAIVKMLVEAGCDVNIDGDEHGGRVIGWATMFNDTHREVAEYLLSVGAEHTIYSAVAMQDAEAVRALVDADPNVLKARLTDHDQCKTPLHLATEKNLPDMVGLLLELGADPNTPDALGATPLNYAARRGFNDVVALLRDVTVSDELLLAIVDGNRDRARQLIAHDPTLLERGGRLDALLCDACVGQSVANVELLLQLGAHADAVFENHPWGKHLAPLHFAAQAGDVVIIDHLLEHGADPTAKDGVHGSTPAGWAHFFQKRAAHERLKRAEAEYLE